jgi:preprotein translocase subunit YajC
MPGNAYKELFMKKMASLFLALIASLIIFSAAAMADGPVVPAVPATTNSAPVTSSAPQAPASNMTSMIIPFVAMFAIFYFLTIRPQQKKMKEQQDMIGALKQGDEVLTASGILGKITGITEKVVTVEIADNVRIKMMKSQISQVIKGQIKDLS